MNFFWSFPTFLQSVFFSLLLRKSTLYNLGDKNDPILDTQMEGKKVLRLKQQFYFIFS